MAVDKKRADNSREIESTAPSGLPDENPLSEREMDVSRLLVTGATNSEIARELVISPHTVKVHLRNVFEKLQVNSRTEASMVLLQRGWIVVPGVSVPDNASGDGGDKVAESQEREIPQPERLDDLHPAPALWQHLYLAAALLICVAAVLLPNWLSRPKTWFTLLSDVGQTVVGKPTPDSLPRWEARTPLAQPRSRAASALVGDQFLVIGGENAAGNTLALVDAYDLRFNQWDPLPALPQPLANAGAAVWNDEVFVAGGSVNVPDGDPQIQIADTLFALAPQGGLWRSVGTLPGPLAGASLVADADALYLLGGWDGQAMHDEIWRLEMRGAATSQPVHWELIGRMPQPAAFFGAVMLEGEIYIVGGYDGLQELAQATLFNPAGGQSRSLAPLSTPRSGLRLVYDDLGVVALGGGWTRTVDTHERYDAFGNQWSNFPSPIRGEWRHFAAVVKEGNIHIVGGWSGDYLDTHLLYQSSFRALLPVIAND